MQFPVYITFLAEFEFLFCVINMCVSVCCFALCDAGI